MTGGQNYLLLAMDMAKVGGPLSVVKGFHTNLIVPSPLPTTTLVSRNNLSVTHQLSEIMRRCLGAPFLGAVVNQRQPEATKPSTVHAGHIVYVYVSGVCM